MSILINVLAVLVFTGFCFGAAAFVRWLVEEYRRAGQ